MLKKLASNECRTTILNLLSKTYFNIYIRQMKHNWDKFKPQVLLSIIQNMR